MVHYLETKGIVTFDQYADQVFVPHIKKKPEELILCGTRTSPTASRNRREKNEERVFGERLQATTSSHQTGRLLT